MATECHWPSSTRPRDATAPTQPMSKVSRPSRMNNDWPSGAHFGPGGANANNVPPRRVRMRAAIEKSDCPKTKSVEVAASAAAEAGLPSPPAAGSTTSRNVRPSNRTGCPVGAESPRCVASFGAFTASPPDSVEPPLATRSGPNHAKSAAVPDQVRSWSGEDSVPSSFPSGDWGDAARFNSSGRFRGPNSNWRAKISFPSVVLTNRGNSST